MDVLDRLRTHLIQVPAQLGALSEAELTQKIPDKWSKKEILGHLIDSAINNLKRFTDAQFMPEPYRLQRYSQDRLVIVNRYQDLPLDHLLTLWTSLNRQIVYVAEAIPAETLRRPIDPGDAPTQSLAWLIEDYVLHLEHHLKTLR
ncbi:DinB family protein [Spirosoma koreense]